MKYYLSHSLIGLLYLFFTAITAFAILMIQDLIWLKVILLVLNLALYVFIVATVAKKDTIRGTLRVIMFSSLMPTLLMQIKSL